MRLCGCGRSARRRRGDNAGKGKIGANANYGRKGNQIGISRQNLQPISRIEDQIARFFRPRTYATAQRCLLRKLTPAHPQLPISPTYNERSMLGSNFFFNFAEIFDKSNRSSETKGRLHPVFRE
jgi:hypothetical protein